MALGFLSECVMIRLVQVHMQIHEDYNGLIEADNENDGTKRRYGMFKGLKS